MIHRTEAEALPSLPQVGSLAAGGLYRPKSATRAYPFLPPFFPFAPRFFAFLPQSFLINGWAE